MGVLLEAEGYAAESAESGEAALALLDRGGPCPDLVLADVQMPGLTATRLSGRLRRACGRTTPLLAMAKPGRRRPLLRVRRLSAEAFTMQQVAEALTAHARGRPPKDATAKKKTKGVTEQLPAQRRMVGLDLAPRGTRE